MKNLYLQIALQVRKGHRPVDILKRVRPDVYASLTTLHGLQSYRQSVGGRLSSEILYRHFHPQVVPSCAECGVATKFINFKEGYSEFCSFGCANKAGGSRRARCRATMLVNYGVEHPAQHIDIKANMVNTMLSRYGVENAQQSAKIRGRALQTNLLRYGYANPMHNAAVFDKCMRSNLRTKFVYHQGRVFSLQGYEPQALAILHELAIPMNMSEYQITGIPYVYKTKSRLYFPDFVLGNLVVEVKSEYTAGLTGAKDLRRNLVAKLRGVRASGKDFLLLVMNKDGTLYRCCFNSFRLTEDLRQYRADILYSVITGFYL